MQRYLLLTIFSLILSSSNWAFAQTEPLTVETIMQDATKWIGTSPHNIWWGKDNQTVYFFWNPDKNPADSVYEYNLKTKKISKSEEQSISYRPSPYQNIEAAKRLYYQNGDLYRETDKGKPEALLTQINGLSEAYYGISDKLYIVLNNNLYRIDKEGTFSQLTNFVKGKENKKNDKLNQQDAWLNNDQLAYFEVLKERKSKRELQEQNKKKPKKLISIYTGDAQLSNITISPDEQYITFLLAHSAKSTNTIVPDYVTESGYTEDLNARPKVGSLSDYTQLGIFNINEDTVFYASTAGLPGFDMLPEFTQLYPNQKYVRDTSVMIHGPWYSGNYAKMPLFEIRSMDNKDRWIALYDLANKNWKVIDHQRDEAWISGPGIGWLYSPGTLGWMPDGQHVYYQSEADGFSHLYQTNISTLKTTQLTEGKFEIYDPVISKNKKYWYFQANKDDAGSRQFYRMPLQGGNLSALTTGQGRHDVTLSPDEKHMAILYSSANQPPELYIQPTGLAKPANRITHSQTQAWQAYDWMVPEFIQFKARDGKDVPARLYKPEQPNGAAVVFVHGAGYLQNAHKWWSTYFREYMFHNLLTQKGYTVLDIDYRGSAGYGRDWRTGIYRHMGGKDLDDQVDGAKWLNSEHNIDSERIGIYGGSYGGFITLMALFTQPDVFAAGAALRSVTDWAHYNHPYTSNILNEPATDSLAYAQSSPIYFAEGLTKPLLICHGMVDTNVHFQDVVRLAQRLIELKKEDWEMAVYPVEGHGFVEPSSWTDEYSRILKLFEEELKE